MIVGIGTDLVDIRRIEKALAHFGERFEARLFTINERAKANQRSSSARAKAATLAKRFAAKEAFAKALGTGIRKGISWQEIEVVSDALGRPGLELTGKALDSLHCCITKDKQPQIHLSLTDEYPYAQAWVIIEAL